MPALRVFGRRWWLAEDDVPFISGSMLIIHMVWVGLLIGWLIDVELPNDCVGIDTFIMPVSVLLGALVVAAALQGCITVVSLRGSMFERSKRRALPALLYAAFATYAVQVGFNVYATVLMYAKPPHCPLEEGKEWDPKAVLWWLIWTTWVGVFILLVLGMLLYNSFPNFRDPRSWERQYMCAVWTSFACCCCFEMVHKQGRQRQRGWAQREGVVQSSLWGHMDLTPSDTVVAFWLAMTLQRAKRKKAKADAEVETPPAVGAATSAAGVEAAAAAADSALSRMERADGGTGAAERSAPERPVAAVDAATLQEGAHFCQYAFAVYGWMLYVYSEGALGLAQLCCCTPGCARRATAKEGLSGMVGARRLNREAAAKVLPCADEDLLFMRTEGELVDVLPYIIAVDTKTKSVVLTIRGALSVEDNVRDLLLDPADLDSWLASGAEWDTPPPKVQPAGPDSRFAAHSGYLEVARATLADVQDTGMLREALQGPTARCSGYQLIVTGHSLGAGCAFLLALRLRQLVPNLKCWCFSPPGGLASPGACLPAVDWCTTVVCGKEWAPRFSYATLDRVRDEMIEAVARCRRPKSVAVFGGSWEEAALFHPLGELPEEVQQVMQQYHASLDSDPVRQRILQVAGPFIPPGRVIYMRQVVSTPARGLCRGGPIREYAAEWIDAEELMADGLLLSGRMNEDHMPNHHLAVLTKLAEKAGKGQGKGAAPCSVHAADVEVSSDGPPIA